MHVKDLWLRQGWAALAVILGSLLAPLAVQAQQSPDRLKSLTVSVWLEYDRPGGLYILRGELPSDVTLPATLVFRLPGRTGGPSSTAGVDSSGNFRYVRPTLREDGDSIVVEYETNWPGFQLEYYDDALTRQGQNRQLEFSYRAEYAIEQLVLEAKEPYGATSFTVIPAGDAQSQGEDGLTVHRRNIGPVAPGQEVTWKAAYDKADARLSVEALGLPTPGSSAYESGPGVAPPAQNQTPIIVAVFAVLGIVTLGGLGLALRADNSRPAAAKAWAGGAEPGARRGRKRRAKGMPEPPQVRPARYCHQCGAALSRDDVFCRKCGTRRRGA